MKRIVVCGAGGFIGGHLVAQLIKQGETNVLAVDVKNRSQWFQYFPKIESLQLDLQVEARCQYALNKADIVYNLAADMGGIAYIEANRANCMLNVLINTNLLLAAKKHGIDPGVSRFFFASSACVYPDMPLCQETDAYPAMPKDGYGWEKLFSERMCRHFREDFHVPTRVARFHNIYGPHGAYDGGREKAPAAICRKVIEAKFRGLPGITIWGDGSQLRSFTYIDDCIKGIQLITDSEIEQPLNLGSSEQVTINQLVDLVEEIAGTKLTRTYVTDAPVGVQGRNSDNTMIKACLGWEPSIRLRDGLERTYAWIYDQMVKKGS